MNGKIAARSPTVPTSTCNTLADSVSMAAKLSQSSWVHAASTAYTLTIAQRTAGAWLVLELIRSTSRTPREADGTGGGIRRTSAHTRSSRSDPGKRFRSREREPRPRPVGFFPARSLRRARHHGGLRTSDRRLVRYAG